MWCLPEPTGCICIIICDALWLYTIHPIIIVRDKSGPEEEEEVNTHISLFFQMMMMMDPTKVVGWSYHQYEEEEVEEGEIVGTVPQLVNKLKDTHKSVIKTMPQLVNVNLQDIVNFSKVLTDTIISLDKAVMMKKTTATAAAAAAMPDNYQWIQNKMDGIIFDIKQLQHQLLQTVSHTAVGNNIIIISIISLSLSLSLSLS